jgi:hypothetical protein
VASYVIDSSASGQTRFAASCEDGNEPSVSLKGWKIS